MFRGKVNRPEARRSRPGGRCPAGGERNGNSIMIDVPAFVAVLIQNEIGASIIQQYLNKGKKEQNCIVKNGTCFCGA